MAFAQLKTSTEKVEMSVPKSKEFNKPYSIEEQDIVVDDIEDISEGKKLQNGLDAWIDVLEEEDASEKRMGIIGQNGNDGLHYEQEDIYQENRETSLERQDRLADEYNRKKNWGKKG